MTAKKTDNTNAQFDAARYKVWKLFMAIMKTVDPNFKEKEPE